MRVGTAAIDVGHARQRCVLVVLLLDANRMVRSEQLLERVWGERPPHRARNVLSGYLSRLRRALVGADGVRITREPGGYMLATDPDTVDVHRFRRLVERGRATKQADEAAALLDSALQCWRGQPFAALDTPWLREVRDTLEAECFAAELDRNDLALECGRHGELIAEIAARESAHPLDERLMAQLMYALYQSGRRGEALAAFQRIRRRLVDELGTDPGPPLENLHQQVLRGDVVTAVHKTGLRSAEPPSSMAPHQLPAIPRSFIGRTREMAELDALLTRQAGVANTVVISALSGTGGIGKTTLAVFWAHRNRDRFPDGQLYADLRGFDPTGLALDPGEAVRGFLEALGVHHQRIPDTLDAQVGLYRSLLAGRRVLVVLDNARDVGHVRALLPGTPSCLALVTSRTQLTGLIVNEGAVGLSLDLLNPAEARSLMARRLGAARLDLEPQAVDEIIRMCAGLPLALAIVSSRAAVQRDVGLAALADRLRDRQGRLDILDVGDSKSSVRAVFSWSYQALSPDAARVFRLLGLHPGPEISEAAAASLAGCPRRSIRRMLAELTNASLLSQPSPGRSAFHDLVHAYARELADSVESATERDEAMRRMVHHYLQTANTADHLLYPHRDLVDVPTPPPGTVTNDLRDAHEALSWFSREKQALLAVARQAVASGLDDCTWLLAWAMVNYLDRQGHWLDWVGVHEDVARSCARRGDVRGRAVAHRGLQRAWMHSGRYDDADRHGRQALSSFESLGDRAGQAQTELVFGATAARRGHHEDGLSHALRAQALYEAAGHRAGQANALNNAGFAYVLLGQHERARDLCRQAIALEQQVGDRYMEGMTWDSLGYAYHHLGDHAAAMESYENALALLREQGDRFSEADTLARLGDSCRAAGHGAAAHRYWQLALEIYTEVRHPDLDELRSGLADRMAGSGQGGGKIG